MNRATILYIAESLDGYIADSKGGVGWLGGEGDHPNEGENEYAEFIETVDTVVMGRNTYDQITTEFSPENWPYRELRCYVLTSREAQHDPNVQFVHTDAGELVRTLQAQPGKRIWICGGAAMACSLINEDLIDLYHIAIMPVLLGKGVSLFAAAHRKQELSLVRAYAWNGVVSCVYNRRQTEEDTE